MDYYDNMPMGCVPRERIDLARAYASTEQRASDHVQHLSRYWGSAPHRHGWSKELPAKHLNELGPRGYNYFRVTQVDELRQRHEVKLAVARRSPKLRGIEAGFHMNPANGFAAASLVRAMTASQSLSSLPDYEPPPRGATASSASMSGLLHGLERPSSVSTLRSTAYSHYAPAPQREQGLPPPNELLRSRPSMQELFRIRRELNNGQSAGALVLRPVTSEASRVRSRT